MLKFILFLTLIVIPVGLSPSLVYSSDYHSPRTDALGGAGHAAPLLGDAIYLNPSYSSFTNARSIAFDYLIYNGGIAQVPENYRGHDLNLTLFDGTASSLFQAGVGFTRRDDVNMLHVGAAKAPWSRFGIGIGSKFIFPNDKSGNRLVDGTFSISGIALKWLQTAFIVDNLFQAATSYNFYREYILGVKFNFNPYIMFYIDPHWAPNLPAGQTTFGYQAGVEVPFFRDFFVRAGTFKASMIPYQNTRGDGYGIGAGWVAPKLMLDYAYARALRPIQSYDHNFSITVYF